MLLTRKSFYNIYLPCLLFLIAFFWKFFYLETRDICIDEPYTIFNAQLSAAEVIKLSVQNENNPPLFMLLLHYWIKLFGISALSVRMLPLLFNALTAVFLFLTGKKVASLWSGILASGLFIFSTTHFYFGMDTRAYSLLSLATAASLYYFISLIRNPEDKKVFVALIAANCILIYSNYFGWFIVTVQFLGSFIYFGHRKLFRKLIYSTIATGILFLPLAPVLIRQFLVSAKGTWVQPPAKTEYLHQLWFMLNDKLVFNTVALILIAGITYVFYMHKYGNFKREIAIICMFWFIPYTIMFFVSSKIPMFLNSYILFTSIGFYAFIAIAVNLLFNQITGKVVSIALLILMFSQIQINAKDFYYREVKNAVNKVKSETTSNSIVIIYPHWADQGFIYYYDQNIFKDFRNYDSLLLKNRLFNVWNIQMAKDYIEKYKNNRIIYYQDGQTGDKSICDYLNDNYVKIDSAFYPECFNVVVFEGGKTVKPSISKQTVKNEFTKKVEGLINYIKTDKNWYNAIKEKALKKNIPIDSMLLLDATWQVEQDSKKK